MDLVTAKAVLTELKRGGFYEKELPEADGEILNDAEYFVEEARIAFEEGWGKNLESVQAVLSLVNLTPDESEVDNSNMRKEEPLRERHTSSSKHIGNGMQQFASENGGDSQTAVASHTLIDLAHGHGLIVPAEIQYSAPEMPRDITELTDIKVRKLYSEFNALLNYSKWQLAMESSDLNDAVHLREAAYREAYVNTSRLDEETGKSKTATLIDMEVKTSKNYQKYDELVRQHTVKTTGLKALVDIYSSNVDRLSREMTFRQFEWEKSR